MKKKITLFMLSFLFLACQETKINDVDLDFSLSKLEKETTAYIGKPVNLNLSVLKVDKNNNYPFQIKINAEKGNIKVNDKPFVKGKFFNLEDLERIEIEYLPTEKIKDFLTITVRNELVEREEKIEINTTGELYDLEINAPNKALIETKFDFDLLVREAEQTNNVTVQAYAKVIGGVGNVFYGEEIISSLEDEQPKFANLSVGKNKITYLSNKEGENIIRFFLKNKYGTETHKDVSVNISLPTWNVRIGNNIENIPIKETHSFNLSIIEDDLFKDNSYKCAFRFIENSKGKITVNAKEIKEGEEFVVKAGANVCNIQVDEQVTEGKIEFIIQDKFKQEKTETFIFTTKVPVKPIVLTLDKTSKTTKVNNKIVFSVTVDEDNYNGTFDVSVISLVGNGTFDSKEMKLSKGTHNLGYLPKQAGTHTFRVVVRDNNNQQKEINATVQVEEQPVVVTNATTGGTATGAGSFDYNSNATVTAQPNSGYTFLGWYENDKKVSDSNSYTFVVKGNVTLQAKFKANVYKVVTNATTGGTVTGSGDFEHNNNATVTAEPNTGYTFLGWYENDTKVSNSENYTFVVDRARNLTAKFKANGFKVTANATTGGSATGSGNFDYNSNATVTAQPNSGYTFLGWYENDNKVSESTSYTFVVKGNITLQAKFIHSKFKIVANTTIGGSATGSGTFDYNSEVTITAQPNTGYTFLGWYENDNKVSNSENYTFVVDRARNLTAKFGVNKFSVLANATTGGSATGSGNFDYNSNATVTAQPNSGYTFLGWYENDKKVSDSNSYTFVVKGNITLQAKFKANSYKIVANTTTGGTATGSGTFDYNSEVTITAQPNTGYTFLGWYENDNKVSESTSYTFVVDKARNLTAKFKANSLKVLVNATTGGSAIGSGNFDYNSNATVTAQPNENYTFLGWYENDNKVSESTSYTFVVDKARNLTAKFKANSLKVIINKTTGGSATGSGTFDYNSEVTITAQPNVGYTFLGWYENDNKVSESTSYTFVVDKARNLTAKFKANVYKVVTNATSGGTVTGSGDFEHNNNATVTAQPNTGYTFLGWYENDKKVSDSNSYTFVVKGNVTLQAKFKANVYKVVTNATSGGTATGAGSFDYNSNATVTAKPNDDYKFLGWYENDNKVSNSENYTFVVDRARNLTAKFVLDEVSLVVREVTDNGRTANGTLFLGENKVIRGKKFTLKLKEAYNRKYHNGHYFLGWYENEVLLSTDVDYTISVDKDKVIVAKFKDQYSGSNSSSRRR